MSNKFRAPTRRISSQLLPRAPRAPTQESKILPPGTGKKIPKPKVCSTPKPSTVTIAKSGIADRFPSIPGPFSSSKQRLNTEDVPVVTSEGEGLNDTLKANSELCVAKVPSLIELSSQQYKRSLLHSLRKVDYSETSLDTSEKTLVEFPTPTVSDLINDDEYIGCANCSTVILPKCSFMKINDGTNHTVSEPKKVSWCAVALITLMFAMVATLCFVTIFVNFEKLKVLWQEPPVFEERIEDEVREIVAKPVLWFQKVWDNTKSFVTVECLDLLVFQAIMVVRNVVNGDYVDE
ncbi:uncharacterized protein LOC131679326 [Topomyia yanbarensis]|uniref:uncharacterized protein LOC131679326 n=1 Tax=Topomyia yanbarensis TaxID=2498891 RepID=UPI00273BCF7A|nr:uncharacterized protein LOC131679326 [Topomyia yanbarensis]